MKHLIGTNVADLVKMSGLKKWLGKKLGKIPTGQLPAGCPELQGPAEHRAQPAQRWRSDPVNDIAALQYTGGTTGTPKGAMLTSYNLVTNALSGKAWIGGDFPRAPAGWGFCPCSTSSP